MISPVSSLRVSRFTGAGSFLGRLRGIRKTHSWGSDEELAMEVDVDDESLEMPELDFPPPGRRNPRKQSGKKSLSKSKMKKLLKQELEKERKSNVFHSFSAFYEEQYGSARWSSLMACLLSKPRVACLVNKYCNESSVPPSPNSTRVPFLRLPVYESSALFPHPERDTHNVFDYYLMDAASVLVTEALDLEVGDKVLDLCAAPGGKTLGILQQLDLLQGSLVANEPSPTRSKRLSKVISEYVPANLRTSIRVTRRNGIKWMEHDLYDKVLVDAPCSSERHLLHDPKELGTWTPRRTENCAKRQLALLFAALRAAKLYGRIVYSTCSLSQLENDCVISKALEKGKLDFEIIQKQWPVGERTEHGWIILPDVSQGWGPIYIAVLKKLSTKLELFEECVEDLEELQDTDGEPLLLLPGPES
ncbi:5-methylcytosine rRNA methyltransferase NSUN4 [Selaginella moellendorffii]|nr:5-methylcytosine rRNA methyltransferase NSUN4 [Selaginella moellendorffii]|eukprot:XP_002993970.2 5-methylcytosine rRNA methyltransferase NSUN4 [Selaginella moellendorffii]